MLGNQVKGDFVFEWSRAPNGTKVTRIGALNVRRPSATRPTATVTLTGGRGGFVFLPPTITAAASRAR